MCIRDSIQTAQIRLSFIICDRTLPRPWLVSWCFEPSQPQRAISGLSVRGNGPWRSNQVRQVQLFTCQLVWTVAMGKVLCCICVVDFSRSSVFLCLLVPLWSQNTSTVSLEHIPPSLNSVWLIYGSDKVSYIFTLRLTEWLISDKVSLCVTFLQSLWHGY